jgi:WD repeat-containing protein 68
VKNFLSYQFDHEMPLFDMLTRQEPVSGPRTVALEFPAFSLAVKRRTLIGSFLRNSNENFILLLETGQRYHHRLPPSRVAWSATDEDRFASTSTSLRVWRVGEEKPTLKLYANSKAGANVPMTSMSWNPISGNRIATCAVDTTVSIWDIDRGKLETQLIAHDKPVFDLTYGNSHQFVSVSEDGSLRLFDTRDLDRSTILYEDSAPLLRVAWDAPNTNLIATIAADSPDVLLFDVRRPGFLAGVVRCGLSCPNAIAWSSRGQLAAGLSDGTAVVVQSTDTIRTSKSVSKIHPETILTPNQGEVTNVAWNQDGLVLSHTNSLSVNPV